MIKDLSTRLQQQLEQDLESLGYEVSNPLNKFSASQKLVREALKKLKEYLDDHPFTNQQEEIHFFKSLKPNIYRWKIYYSELFTIEDNLPVGSIDLQIQYLERERHHVERFFQQYQFQYQYYKLNAVELDSLYFVRGVEIQSILLPDVPELDASFSTSCDYLFSKIKAYELIKDWVNEKLLYLKKNPLTIDSLLQGNAVADMHWTGDTINLAELGYGLYHTKQLNNGSAGIGEIFRWLEEKFGVSIGIPAKKFAQIRDRKRLSRTKFLDEMKDGNIRRFDKEDEYFPENEGRNMR